MARHSVKHRGKFSFTFSAAVSLYLTSCVVQYTSTQLGDRTAAVASQGFLSATCSCPRPTDPATDRQTERRFISNILCRWCYGHLAQVNYTPGATKIEANVGHCPIQPLGDTRQNGSHISNKRHDYNNQPPNNRCVLFRTYKCRNRSRDTERFACPTRNRLPQHTQTHRNSCIRDSQAEETQNISIK